MDNLSAPIPSTFSQPAISSPAEPPNRHWLLWLIGGAVLLGLGIALGFFSAKFLNQPATKSQISSYEDCLAAKGSIVQYSYPATCVTASGQRFVQPLTDEEKQGLQPPDLYREPASSAATANWKTYTNEQAGYSLKYSETWKFQADSEGCGPVFFYPSTTKIWLTICGLHINQGDTPEEMANRSANSSSAKLESREQVLIDGHSGIKQLVKTGDTQLAIETYVGNVVGIIKFANGQTSKDTGTLAIYYYIQDLDKLTEARSSLDQILSTFHFLK